MYPISVCAPVCPPSKSLSFITPPFFNQLSRTNFKSTRLFLTTCLPFIFPPVSKTAWHRKTYSPRKWKHTAYWLDHHGTSRPDNIQISLLARRSLLNFRIINCDRHKGRPTGWSTQSFALLHTFQTWFGTTFYDAIIIEWVFLNLAKGYGRVWTPNFN